MAYELASDTYYGLGVVTHVFKFHPLVCPALQTQWFIASAPTSLLDHKPCGEFKFQMSAFSAGRKMLYYRDASALETKILANSGK